MLEVVYFSSTTEPFSEFPGGHGMCFLPLNHFRVGFIHVMLTASCSPHMIKGIGIGVAEGSDKDGMVEAQFRAVGRRFKVVRPNSLNFQGGMVSGWSLYVTSHYTSYVIDRYSLYSHYVECMFDS